MEQGVSIGQSAAVIGSPTGRGVGLHPNKITEVPIEGRGAHSPHQGF